MEKNVKAIIICIISVCLIGGLFILINSKKKEEPTPTPELVVEQVTISFDSDGAGTIQDKTIEKGNTISLPIPKKDGYDFIKWVNEEGNEVTNATVYNENTELKAIWEKKIIIVEEKKPVSIQVKPIIKYIVPETGRLIDLYNNGVLQNVFGLNKATLENQFTQAGFENATYYLDGNGALSISYPIFDISNGNYKDDYVVSNFGARNTINYFTNSNNYSTYKVPAENSKGSINDIADLLRDVFDVNVGDYTGFKYSGGSLSLFKELQYFKDETLYPNESYVTEYKKYDSQMLTSDFNQFEGLLDAIKNYTDNAGNSDNLFFAYSSDGQISAIQKVPVEKPKNIDTRETSLDGLSENEKNAITSMLGKFDPQYISLATNASDIPYSVIEEIASSTPDVTNGESRTFTADEINAATAIMSVIDNAFKSVTDAKGDHPTEFKLTDLNGDAGIIVKYTSTETSDLSFPSGSSDVTKSQKFKRKAALTLNGNDYKNSFVFNENPPAYVFKNTSEFGKSYFVPNDSLTRKFMGNNNSIINFINAVYQNTSSISFDHNIEYTMIISNTGKLTITHEGYGNDDYSAFSKYSVKNNNDGTYSFTEK